MGLAELEESNWRIAQRKLDCTNLHLMASTLDLSLFGMDSHLSPDDTGGHGSDSEMREDSVKMEGERDDDVLSGGPAAGGETPGTDEKKKKAKRGGRPKADVWELFSTYGERNERTRRFLVTCNACASIIDGRVDGMERHIGYDCTRTAEDEKMKWQEKVVEKVKLIKVEGLAFSGALKPSSAKRVKKMKRGPRSGRDQQFSDLCCFLKTNSMQGITSNEEAVERFREYLRIPTGHPDPDYNPAVRYLLTQAYSIGLEAQTLEFVKKKPIVVMTWKGEHPFLQSILLNSHMDVKTVDKEKWKHDPFVAFMNDDGDIFARGAQDMKCTGMQYLEAIRNLRSEGFSPLRSIHITFVPDEEIGGGDGFGRLVSSPEFQSLNVGVALDEGEPSEHSEYRIFHGERSSWWLVIRALGEPGHGSKLYDNSAIENLQKSMEVISRFRAAQFDLLKAGIKVEGEIISINTLFLKAGSATPMGYFMNMQPSEAEAGFDIRIPPFADTESLERRIAEEWAPAYRNLTYKFEQRGDTYAQALVTPLDSSNPWWHLFEHAVAKTDGKLSPPEIHPSATDARFIRAAGIPAFGFSPMSNTPILIHEHNEFVNARDYLKGIQVYESIVRSFSSFPGLIENTISS